MTDTGGGEASPLPQSLRVYLLGEFKATLDGRDLPHPPYRTLSLLAALLLQPRLRYRTQLVGLLFPEMPERKGRQRLSHLLWELRRWLPALPLEATSQTLQLSPESVWLDVSAFREAAASDDPESWFHALALYRGGLMEGLYDDWLLDEREALYLRYVHLSHHACDALWQKGRYEELLPLAERLVQQEPFDERALRMLMRAYQAIGRRGAALEAYERCLSLVQHEIRVDLEPATQALAQALRSPSSTAPATPPAPVGEESTATTLERVRQALLRGERVTVTRGLEHLRDRADCPHDEIRLLEVDLALLVEDYDQAESILEGAGVEPSSGPERLRWARLAQGRRQDAAAREMARNVLMDAQRDKDRETELGAMLVLAGAEHRLGNGAQAARIAQRALDRARQSGFHYGVARALILQGGYQVYQGGYERARECFQQARAVALEHSLRYDLAGALRGLRCVLAYTNVMAEALSVAQEELSIWRDLGLYRWEAATLEGVALIQSYLGRSADSLRTSAQARAITRRLGDPLRTAINGYNMACNLVYHDDELTGRAASIARDALDTFRVLDEPKWESTTLTILGYALWIDGEPASALDHFRQAQTISERMGDLVFIPELLAYRGLAQLALAQPGEALQLTRQAMLAMAQGDVTEEVIPEIYYAHAVALAANDRDEDAHATFSRAYEHLLAGAAQLEDREARAAYFHRNPTTRRLMQELQTRGIAPASDVGVEWVELPDTAGDGSMRIQWTVDAGPADTALKQTAGAIGLRRAQLARLLEEARAQGAAPTNADLARALGVSTRTIQRDRAALRRDR